MYRPICTYAEQNKEEFRSGSDMESIAETTLRRKKDLQGS